MEGTSVVRIALAGVISAIMVLGCGRLSFQSLARDGGSGDGGGDAIAPDGAAMDGGSRDGAPDGSTDGDTPPDGSFPDVGLPGDAAVGTAVRFVNLGEPGAADRSPSLRADLLEIYFSSDRSGGSGSDDIWRSTRTSLTAPWELPTPVTALNTSQSETAPELSRDGLTLMFSRSDTRGANLFTATRADPSSPWGSVTEQAEINSGAFDGCPTLSADALEIVFCSQRRGGTQDLHTAARTTTAEPFGVVNYLGPLSTASTESGPYVGLSSQLRMLFASDRPGGSGGFDIYETSRSDPTSAWAAPGLFPLVNSAANEADPWSTDDGRLLVFSSDRSGDYELYVVLTR